MLNRKIIAAGLFVSITCPGAVLAQEEAKSPHALVGNLTLTSDYVFRGLTQTNGMPAVQGTLEYNHASGFYAGIFGSNVSWFGDAWEPAAGGADPAVYGGAGGGDGISNSLETDFYLGFRNKFAGDFSYDVGAIYYYYPGKYYIANTQAAFGTVKPHTAEVYGGIGWKWITGKVYYSVTEGIFGVDDGAGSYYLDLSATVPIGESGFNVVGHVGTWKFAGEMLMWRNGGTDNSVYDFSDWKVGVTKDFFGLSWGLFYTGTTADKTTTETGAELAVFGNRYGENVGDDRIFLTVTKTF